MHDEDSVVLRFPVTRGQDLRAFLEALGRPEADGLHWVVGGLACVGGGAFVRRFSEDLDRAPGRQAVVPGERLLQYADEVGQTVEGDFVGFRSAALAKVYLDGQGSRALARWAIDCVDSTWWEVRLDDRAQADRLLESLPGGRRVQVSRPPHSAPPSAVDRYLPLDEPRLYDVVRAAVGKEDEGIAPGTLGTLVMLHDDDAFEVEFVRDDGSTLGVCTMRRDELRSNRLIPEP